MNYLANYFSAGTRETNPAPAYILTGLMALGAFHAARYLKNFLKFFTRNTLRFQKNF